MKKRRKSPNLPKNEGAPLLFRSALSKWGRAPIIWGRALIIKGALHDQPAPFHLSKPSPTYLPATSADSPPPHLGQRGTTYPSTPFDMKSSIAASWPRDGLLTTSQAVTMNPRSQWVLFEFEKRLNPFAPAAKRLSDRPENLHMGWKKIKNKNTFWRRFFFATRLSQMLKSNL